MTRKAKKECIGWVVLGDGKPHLCAMLHGFRLQHLQVCLF